MNQRTGIFRRPTPSLPMHADERNQPRHTPSGRVSFDDRGNAVWQMRVDERTYTSSATTTLVRKLQVPGLSIEATAVHQRPVMPAPPPAAPQLAAPPPLATVTSERHMAPETAGFNPYNRSASGLLKSQVVRQERQRQAVRKLPARPASKPGLFDRLLGRR